MSARRSAGTARRPVSVAAFATVSSLIASPLAAQAARCDLLIQAPTRSSIGQGGQEEGTYTTFLGGGTVTLRCGSAVMTGDSAVHYESEERAVMLGDVSYRDTTRTLSSDALTYFEGNSQVVATGDVELTRLSTGARLSGPRVSFFRGALPGGRTVATGRPRMTIPSDTPGGEAIVVDADTAEFLGSDEARARGKVEIARSDFEATADSARFTPNLGQLYGDPVVTSRAVRLTGDSIRAEFDGSLLEAMHAYGSARARGETLELASEELRIAIEGQDVERVEAFGAGRSVAGSGDFIVAGDSLDFAFAAGAVDSASAAGDAVAFRFVTPRDPESDLVEPRAEVSDAASWLRGDSVRAWFETTAGAADQEARLRRLRAIGAARAYFSQVRDSTRSTRPSRNYLIGRSVDIAFVDGEPSDVVSEQAIGVFLEPSAETP